MAIVIKAIKNNLKYVPMTQLGEEKPFAVIVKPVDIKSLMTLEDQVVKREGEAVSFSMGRYAFDVCKASVIGWENIEDADGNPIEFKKSSDGVATDNTIAYMGTDIIQEVANVVSAISRDSSKVDVFFPEMK
jgi:hypothetical protein